MKANSAYLIAAGETLLLLEERVNAIMTAGFVPHAQPFPFPNGWAQAMVFIPHKDAP